jgi:hypothetical protein
MTAIPEAQQTIEAKVQALLKQAADNPKGFFTPENQTVVRALRSWANGIAAQVEALVRAN